jgi:hypothetical protein
MPRALKGEEWTNIRDLAIAVANKMREIARGRYDVYVRNVFGDAHVDDAKKIFGEAADALDELRPGFISSSIVVDTMRKSEVWCCGGTYEARPHGATGTHGRQRKGSIHGRPCVPDAGA